MTNSTQEKINEATTRLYHLAGFFLPHTWQRRNLREIIAILETAEAKYETRWTWGIGAETYETREEAKKSEELYALKPRTSSTVRRVLIEPLREIPEGAIENGRELFRRVLEHYDFENENSSLRDCAEFNEALQCFEHLAEYVMQEKNNG